jgi:ribosome-associated protein
MESQELTQLARRTLLDKKGENIVVLDIRKLSEFTDFFVLVTGASPPHLKALLEEVRQVLKKHGVLVYRTSGDPLGGWMTADYVDVVIHAMLPATRDFYGIEALWSQAPRVP